MINIACLFYGKIPEISSAQYSSALARFLSVLFIISVFPLISGQPGGD